MKVVIQCAGRKRSAAGKLRDADGVELSFVACPELFDRTQSSARPCRPDDLVGAGDETWRNVLTGYNERYQEGENPDRLLPAGDLYSPRAYRCLVDAFGASNVYILSAGWGLVRADYLLPDYDITFSNQKKVPKYARRGRRNDGTWKDFCQLHDADLPPDEAVHFFGGRDYLSLYYRAVDDLAARKVIHHKGELPHRSGYEYRQYNDPANTNWHYSAAEHFIRTHSPEAK